jgi:hypothetical protein
MFDQFSPLVNVLLLSLIASLGTALGSPGNYPPTGQAAYGFLWELLLVMMICLSFMELVNEAWELGGPRAATLGLASARFLC